MPLEDLALKAAAQYFGEELLPYLGITEKIVGIAPTEQEMISMTILGQMIMEDGIEKGIEKGIRALVQDYLEEGVSKECILGKLQKHFELPLEKAAEYYNEYVECN